ncbi:3-oxoacyl-[acyl-carrier-protein] reductase [Lacihabitans lacunae]|uniref:3-oxoacyl-[acyl-carrier-protein] reductase n=1 Tax=Lacihabitans lacunae TaxID=1028214 RepID=A0ABV7YUL0_9BACT
MKNKNVLITGASRGIGKAIAEEFAKAGANVAFTYLSSVEKGTALETELSAFGTKIKGYRSDASDYTAAEELINQVVADFGSIEVLINNAGITKDTLLMRMSEEQWDDVLRINLKSIFNLTKAATKPMMRAKTGSIINISSVVGLMGNAGQANYAASKAGMIGFSKSIAKELGSRNIRCNVVAPGFIETEMTGELNEEQLKEWTKSIPLKRAGQGKDIADACLFLGSDNSAYITGQVLVVDGGMLM